MDSHGPMTVKSLFTPLFAWFLATSFVVAQPLNLPGSRFVVARSYSGQFTAREMRDRSHWTSPPSAMRIPVAGSWAFLINAPPKVDLEATEEVPLEPPLVVVTCERLKEMFLMEAGMVDNWRGRIDLIINRTLPQEKGPRLTAVHGPEGWSYELELPSTIRPAILVRSVIQTLLLEVANRQAGIQSAEIPFWLVDGLSAHLQAFNLPTYILRPNLQTAGYQKLSITGMEEVRSVLGQRAPLTFQQLSWPEKSDVAGKDEQLYRCCAQLLFESLQHLPDGQACFQRMLAESPKHYNWQTSFLIGFHSHFAALVDVEKWWGVNCVNFVSANLSAARTAQESYHQLQDALDVPVEVKLGPSPDVAAARVTLQEAITQWDPAAAQKAVQRAVLELQQLELFNYRCEMNLDFSVASASVVPDPREMPAAQTRLTRDINQLVSQYLGTLVNYLKQSSASAHDGVFHYSGFTVAKKEAVRQLNSLDQQRFALRDTVLSASSGSDFGSAATREAGANVSPVPRFRPQ